MAYQALYRKWRPAGFDEVSGQEHVVTALRNQVRYGRVGHAYLFSGTRGTGKTSIAKIFARAVNCENPQDGSPCNECAMCRAINAQRSVNVIEIDAASNNGVDNIRRIREEVVYPPTEGKYKVYIIDEAHMLTPGAFNALLKTLEEPPEYVIFILATTEAHKVPATVVSRCQSYEFRRLPSETMKARLREMADSEGIKAEDEALMFLARRGEGSMRDAISLFDQCAAFAAGETLTYDKAAQVLGVADTSVFRDMLDSVLRQDAGRALQLFDGAVMGGRDISQFNSDFIWYLRNILLLKNPGAEAVIDASADSINEMKARGEDISEERLMYYLGVLSELSQSLRFSSNKRVPAEIALIRLCRPETASSPEALASRLEIIEEKLENGVFTVQAAGNAGSRSRSGTGAGEEDAAGNAAEEAPTMQEAMPEDIQKIIAGWDRIRAGIGGAAGALLQNASVSEGGQGQIMLYIPDSGFGSKFIDGHREELEKYFSECVNRKVNLKLVTRAQYSDSSNRFFDIAKTVRDLNRIIKSEE
ncbi:MAG: DNA polymerase III subunit gamma/tau [Lachnospiraceae bacterium]|nr:DNA polymerase III subunit gamma/tau [Lachnospiraceae bacterium]